MEIFLKPDYLLLLHDESKKQFSNAQAFVVTYLVKGIHHFCYRGNDLILLTKDELIKLNAKVTLDPSEALPVFIDNNLAFEIIRATLGKLEQACSVKQEIDMP